MNRDYLYTPAMIDSGRTAELTAGERMREAADIARDETLQSEDTLLTVGRAAGHTIALTQVIEEMQKLAPGCTDEQRALMLRLVERIQGLQP